VSVKSGETAEQISDYQLPMEFRSYFIAKATPTGVQPTWEQAFLTKG
jgi:hypothetical protein